MATDDYEKVTIRINKGDKEKLSSYYPRLGYNKVIRKLIESFIRSMDERVAKLSKENEIKIEEKEVEDAIRSEINE